MKIEHKYLKEIELINDSLKFIKCTSDVRKDRKSDTSVR